MKIKLSDYDIFYINLDRQPDRKAGIEKDLKKHKLKKFKRVAAVDRDTLLEKNELGYVKDGLGFNHSVAVAKSYTKALSEISKLPSLILEDDARVMHYSEYLDIPDDADAIYLGINEFAMEFQDVYDGHEGWKLSFVSFDRNIGNDDFYRIYGSLGCHAILYITDRFLQATKEAFLESSKTGIPIDLMQHNLQKQFNCYVSADSFFVQENTPVTDVDLRYYTRPKEDPFLVSN